MDAFQDVYSRGTLEGRGSLDLLAAQIESEIKREVEAAQDAMRAEEAAECASVTDEKPKEAVA